MHLKIKEKGDICCPDSIYIRKWNIELNYMDGDSIVASLFADGSVTYSSRSNHVIMRMNNGIKDRSFDFRIWKDKKIVSFWTENSTGYLKKMKRAVHEIEKMKIVDDIFTYHLLFEKIDTNGDQYVVDCELSELDDIIYEEEFEVIANNHYDRGKLHLLSPSLKPQFISQKEIHYRYLSSNKYWKKRIGKMDIAEWHLLINEE